MEKYKEPQIYVVNNKEIAERLSQNYCVEIGNLGVKKIVQYEEDENIKYLNLQYSMIKNLHEYSVVIIDLQKESETEICVVDDQPNSSLHLFEVNFPKKEFRPDPFVLSMMQGELRKQCVKIIFAGNVYVEEYKIVEVLGQNQYSYPNKESHSIYEITQTEVFPKYGRKIKAENNNLATCIEKYAIEYKVIFELPKKWDRNSQIFSSDPNFIPLLKNQDDEVISYIGYSEDYGYEIMLPICEKKAELIERLMTIVLPEILPNFFPESKAFEWIKEQEFFPQEIIELEKERSLIQEDYELKMESLNKKRKTIEKKYNFLNELLIETGDKLVEAVCTYFKWLGFANVELIDGNEDILREDIQILEDNKLYIIEVKGIGGTSTDAECSQVAKHRRRREKEHRGKEIIPIYIVNHQRYMRPLSRQNPPFSLNQIDYAENDERGLLTTWQMYKQFSYINDNVFSKEETRKSLSKHGLIDLVPEDLVLIGKYLEYFKNPKAGIILINNQLMAVGDTIWANKGDVWKRTTIISIQLDGKNVQKVKNGEIGIVTECELDKGYAIYKKNS